MSSQDDLLASLIEQQGKGKTAAETSKNQAIIFNRLFDELTAVANKNIVDKLNTINRRVPHERKESVVEKTLSISYNAMYTIQTMRRTFPLNRLGAFCEYFAGMSCNELALGIKKPVVLPKIPAYIVSSLKRWGYITPDIVRSLIDTYKMKTVPVSKVPTRDLLCLSRVREAADDLQMPPKRAQFYAWGKSNNIGLFFSSQQKISLIRRLEDRNFSHVKLSSALMLTFLLDVPLDYLICEDYTATCDIAVKDNDGNPVIVTDKDLIRVVSIYLSLPEEEKTKMFADIALRESMFRSMFSSIPAF